jgi:hypothetical protein
MRPSGKGDKTSREAQTRTFVCDQGRHEVNCQVSSSVDIDIVASTEARVGTAANGEAGSSSVHCLWS